MLDFGWQTYAFLGGGVLFVLLEVLFPSGGLLGIGAAVCLGFGGFFAYDRAGGGNLLSYCALIAVIVPTAVGVGFKVLPHTPVGKHVILAGPTFDQRAATETENESLVGQKGTARSTLRPSGIANIANRRVDVVTRGERIESGDPVLVLKVEGNRVIVCRAD